MIVLAAQPASVEVMHLYGRFSSDAPGKVNKLPGVKAAHLVTQGRAVDRCCLEVRPDVSISLANQRSLRELIVTIGITLGYSPGAVRLLRPVERRGAGEEVTTVYDWLKLRSNR